MPKPQKILLADNYDSYREITKEYLQWHGYQVAEVASPEACLRAVEADAPHLAILDYRMRDDADEHDESGLTLARQLPARLPKLILTAFPTWEMTRSALMINAQGDPLVAALVSKLEGIEALHDYVKRAFAEHVRLNWDLQIEWQTEDCVSLIQQIEPELEDALAAQRCEEWEDLVCRLFLDAARIEIKQVLWQQAGQLALQVVAVADNQPPKPVLVVSGLHDVTTQEVKRYRYHALETRQAGIPTLQGDMAETIHYAAQVFTLEGVRLSGGRSLQELYQIGLGEMPSGFQFDVENQCAWLDGELLELTPQEFKLLRFLHERTEQLCTCRAIIEEFFGYQFAEGDYTQNDLIDQNIKRLRAKLKGKDYLKTVRGLGFRLTLHDDPN